MAPAEARERDPARGAARREGLLLSAYVVLALTGIWVVVAGELGPDEPAKKTPPVTAPTESSPPAGK